MALAPESRPASITADPRAAWEGSPTCSYPFPWAIYGWIDGQPYSDELVDDEHQAARDLAQFVVDLRRIDPAVAPRGGRRPLHELDAVTRRAIESARGVIDGDAATAAWDQALEAPAWEVNPVWIHTDLLRPNVLLEGGRL